MTENNMLLIILALIIVPVAIAYIKNAYMAAMLIAANIFVYAAVQFYFIPNVGIETVLRELTFNPQLFSQGAYQTLFTSMFMHLATLHIIFNLIFLIFWGSFLENRIGARKVLAVYLLTGLAAGLIYGLFYWGEYRFALGASGALFGIAGCFVAMYPQERLSIILMFIPLHNVKGYVIIILMVLLEIFIAISSPGSRIAHEAHMGGLVAGLAMGTALARISPKEQRVQKVVISLEELLPLAITPELREMLVAARESREPEILQAWVEGFLESAKCPECNNDLGDNDPWKSLQGNIRCKTCGWKNEKQ